MSIATNITILQGADFAYNFIQTCFAGFNKQEAWDNWNFLWRLFSFQINQFSSHWCKNLKIQLTKQLICRIFGIAALKVTQYKPLKSVIFKSRNRTTG